MAKQYWLPGDDAGKDSVLTNVSNKLPKYQATFGLTDEDIAGITADQIFFHFALVSQEQVSAYSQQWTAYKNAARNGTGVALGDLPVAPVFAEPPPVVAPGIFKRLAALVAHIKTHKSYTVAIGQDLQIIGADQTVDPSNMKPVITAMREGGIVTVGWAKQGMDAIEIWVDRGDNKGFVFLAIDSVPDYQDTAVIPAGQSALWKYKAIYLQADQRVGQWSDIISLPVAG